MWSLSRQGAASFRGFRADGRAAASTSFAEGFDAIVVDHELEARLDPRNAVLGGRPPHIDDCAQHRDRLLARDENAQMTRQARSR